MLFISFLQCMDVFMDEIEAIGGWGGGVIVSPAVRGGTVAV